MYRLWVALGLGASLAGSAASAQAQGKYRRPTCELSTSHFLVDQAETYLKGGTEEKDPEKREQLLGDTRRTLFEAIDRGEVENATVWYFLGRLFVLTDDAAGVDTAFARAERLAPRCAEDISYYRQMVWVPLINAAVDSLQAGAFEGAKRTLRWANRLDPSDPVGFYYLARIFASEGETDSAFLYLKRVAQMEPTDSTREKNLEDAVESIALLHHSLEEWDSSLVWHERLGEIDPDNPEALARLAESHAKTGNEDRALELYEGVFAGADAMDSYALFGVGEQLYLSERFVLAARAFEMGLGKNPFSRQGLYNLVSCYRAMAEDKVLSSAERKDAATKMEEAAKHLVEVDPQSQEALGLLAAAYQVQLRERATDRMVVRMNRLKFDITVFFAEPSDGGYMVQGRFRNLRDSETMVPTITFEFLDGEGNVVTTDTAGGESLAGRDSMNFAVSGQGASILAYRYRIEN